MAQKAIIDNILLQNIEQKVGASGYPYSVLTIQISQPGKQGQVDVAQTEVVSGKQEILAMLQVGATYSMEFEPRVGKPQQSGRRFLNLELRGVRQTGGAQQAFDNPAAYNQAPAPQNYNQAPQPQQFQQPQPAPVQQHQQPAPIQQAPAPQQGFAPPAPQNNSAPEDFSDDIPF